MFARLIGENENQILLKKGKNEEDKPSLEIYFIMASGVEIKMGLDYETEEARDENFLKLTDEELKVMIENFKKGFLKNF